MASLNDSNNLNNGGVNLSMDDLLEILSALGAAGDSSKRMSNEMDDATRNFSSAKKAAQDMARGMTKEYGDAQRALKHFADELESINNRIPRVVENTISSLDKAMTFNSTKLNLEYKFDKWFNPIFNDYRIMKDKLVGELDDQLQDLEKMKSKAADADEKYNWQRQIDLVEARKHEIENQDEVKMMWKENGKFWKDTFIKASKEAISSVYRYVRGLVTSAVEHYNQTMEQTYTNIQSHNNYTIKEYHKMFDRINEMIDTSGLKDIVNINDVQQNVSENITAGLTGPLAETIGYYEEIAKKAGTAFDFSNTSFLKAMKRMDNAGEDVSSIVEDMIMSTENISRAAGHTFGFSQNQITTMTESLSELQATIDLSGKAYADTFAAYGAGSSLLGLEEIDMSKIISDITEYSTKGITANSTAQLLNFRGVTQEEVQQKLQDGKAYEIILDYLKAIEDRYIGESGKDAEFVNVASNALNETLSAEEILRLENLVKDLESQGSSVEEKFMEYYEADSVSYEDLTSQLEDSVTETQKLINKIDNLLDSIGMWYNENPILSKAVSAVTSTVEAGLISWFTAGMFKKTFKTLLTDFDGGSGSGTSSFMNKIGSMFNRQPSNGAQMSMDLGDDLAKNSSKLASLGKIFTNGAQGLGSGASGTVMGSTKMGSIASKITSSGFGKVAFSTAGKALGAGASIVSMGVDAVQGYKEDGAAGALRGAITGSGKAAEDAGDVAKGTGIAALKGAGIGMMFGPWGAAIGAAIGGLAGLTTGLIDVTDQTKKYDRTMRKAEEAYAEAVKAQNEYRKSLEKTASVDSEYQTAVERNKNTADLLHQAQNGNTEAFNELKATYPGLIGHLSDVSKLDEDYVKLLEKKIEVEKQGLYNEFYGQDSTTGETVSKGTKTTSGFISSDIKASTKIKNAVQNAYRDIMAGADYDETISAISKETGINKKQIETGLAEYTGVHKTYYKTYTADEVKNMAAKQGKKAWELAGWEYDSLTGQYTRNGESRTSEKSIRDSDLQYRSKITNTSEQMVSDIQNAATNESYFDYMIDDKSTEYGSVLANTSDVLQGYFDMFGSSKYDTLDEKTRSNLKYYAEQLNIQGQNFRDYLYYTKDYQTGSRDSRTERIKAAINTAGYTGEITPTFLKDFMGEDFKWKASYAVGTVGDYTIPYDNYLALLHEGEQVRTKAEVSIDKAEKHIASSDAIGKLNSVLLSQTNSIIDLLSQILSGVTGIGNKIGSTPAQSYDYSPVSI